MREVVAYKRLKTLENSDKTVILKSGRGHLLEVRLYAICASEVKI